MQIDLFGPVPDAKELRDRFELAESFKWNAVCAPYHAKGSEYQMELAKMEANWAREKLVRLGGLAAVF